MAKEGPDEKIRPVGKLTTVVSALAAEGVALEAAFAGRRDNPGRFLEDSAIVISMLS